jgi:hypothetical protein
MADTRAARSVVENGEAMTNRIAKFNGAAFMILDIV